MDMRGERVCLKPRQGAAKTLKYDALAHCHSHAASINRAQDLPLLNITSRTAFVKTLFRLNVLITRDCCWGGCRFGWFGRWRGRVCLDHGQDALASPIQDRVVHTAEADEQGKWKMVRARETAKGMQRAYWCKKGNNPSLLSIGAEGREGEAALVQNITLDEAIRHKQVDIRLEELGAKKKGDPGGGLTNKASPQNRSRRKHQANTVLQRTRASRPAELFRCATREKDRKNVADLLRKHGAKE